MGCSIVSNAMCPLLTAAPEGLKRGAEAYGTYLEANDKHALNVRKEKEATEKELYVTLDNLAKLVAVEKRKKNR